MQRTEKPASILLVGFQDQDNLGLRYLKAAVQQAGFSARIVTYSNDPRALIEQALLEEPLAIGFSLIFQYMAPSFAEVIRALRAAGVNAHITMGGHYPSFDYAQVLGRMEGLDSIVRFEGELTLVELLQRLAGKLDWHDVPGLAFRRGCEITTSAQRGSVDDLDVLPWPDRAEIAYENQDLPTASMLGSRGCPWDCSFCSIRPFYEAQGGALRRLRSPAAVAEEMQALHVGRGVRVFLFQDDDFLGGGKRAREWAMQVAEEIVARELAGKITFKISCRSDEIREDVIAALMRAGLTHVYMGVESGDEQGLHNLSKRLKPDAHIQAGAILKKLGLSFDFGFMLLEPDSTFAMVRSNVAFLERFVGDGWSVASFCRMLPYAGTPVQKRLAEEGRLLGSSFEPDYRFSDAKLDLFYAWMLSTFHERNFTSRGLCHVLKSLHFEARLQLPERNPFDDFERSYARHLTALANGLATATLSAAIEHIEATPLDELQRDDTFLELLRQREQSAEQQLMAQVVDFYGGVRARLDEPRAALATVGGFEKAWTIADVEC